MTAPGAGGTHAVCCRDDTGTAPVTASVPSAGFRLGHPRFGAR
ncbi:hypothetical protein [Streptomyces sp. NPDC101237]